MARVITIIDEGTGEVTVREDGRETRFPLQSAAAFAAVSRVWLRAGWDVKYVYSFTWLGCPVIQLPDDLLRIQEVIYRVRPDVLIETGVAHGGSLIFYASLFKAMGRTRDRR
jgi:cephalosporin hydroxylase